MATLADAIEAYLKRLLGSESGQVEIRRGELADSFSCAPSQINYVLETRFRVEHGYVVESRRGGGGYIRIRRLVLHPTKSQVYAVACEHIGERLDEVESDRILRRLLAAQILDRHQAEQVSRFLHTETQHLQPPWGAHLRAVVLKGILLVLLENRPREGGGES